MRSFLLDFWSRVFACLRWVSPFSAASAIFPRLKNAAVIETWVLAHTILAILCFAVTPHLDLGMWRLAFAT